MIHIPGHSTTPEPRVNDNELPAVLADEPSLVLAVQRVHRENALPQGAPTSPTLSNLVNRGLDAKLARMAERIGMVYSRYAESVAPNAPGDAAIRWKAGIASV